MTVLAVLLASGLLLHQSALFPGELGFLDRALMAVITPLQSGAAGGARFLRRAGDHTVDLALARRENQDLLADNVRLRTELLQHQRLELENERLTRLLGLKDNTTAQLLSARVIAVQASAQFRIARIEIDRGHGSVARGMPVIAPEGVVGRINRVHGSTSDILLLADPASAVDVVLPRSGGRGLLVGQAGDRGYRCQIQYLVSGEAARVGDEVLTSGIGGFPRDLPVGTVVRAGANKSGMFQEVEVRLHVDFARLAEVMVVSGLPSAKAPPFSVVPRAAPPVSPGGLSLGP